MKNCITRCNYQSITSCGRKITFLVYYCSVGTVCNVWRLCQYSCLSFAQYSVVYYLLLLTYLLCGDHFKDKPVCFASGVDLEFKTGCKDTVSYHLTVNISWLISLWLNFEGHLKSEEVRNCSCCWNDEVIAYWQSALCLFSGWIVKTSTSFRRESPIWLLGNMYKLTKSGVQCTLFFMIFDFFVLFLVALWN